MQGKLHFFVSSASKLNLDYASSSSFLSSKRGSQEIETSDTFNKTIKDMTANFSIQLGKIDNDDEFMANEQVTTIIANLTLLTVYYASYLKRVNDKLFRR